jgi:hypothetical protein
MINVTVKAAVGRIPPPPNVTPGWAKKPSPPPNNPGVPGAKAPNNPKPPIMENVDV